MCPIGENDWGEGRRGNREEYIISGECPYHRLRLPERTVTVPLEDFAFWQSTMAHASARSENDPEYTGEAVHRAHEQMYDVLRERPIHTDGGDRS